MRNFNWNWNNITSARMDMNGESYDMKMKPYIDEINKIIEESGDDLSLMQEFLEKIKEFADIGLEHDELKKRAGTALILYFSKQMANRLEQLKNL